MAGDAPRRGSASQPPGLAVTRDRLPESGTGGARLLASVVAESGEVRWAVRLGGRASGAGGERAAPVERIDPDGELDDLLRAALSRGGGSCEVTVDGRALDLWRVAVSREETLVVAVDPTGERAFGPTGWLDERALAIENARDIVFVHDLEGRFSAMNRAGLAATGYREVDLADMTLDQLVAPDWRDLAWEMIRRRSEAPSDDHSPYQLELLTRDGRSLPVELSTSLVFRGGRPVAVQGIARDVSQRRKLEAQLRQAQKMEAVGRLAGGIAHDFNNLLTVINGYSEMLSQALPRDSAHQLELSEIVRAGSRAADLTRQLLAFSRRQVLRPKVMELDAVVANVERMLRRLIGEHIELQTDLGLGDRRVRIDPAQIEQVLVNLVVNARDAMPEGGSLAITTAPVRVGEGQARHWAIESGSYAELKVDDTGSGMDGATLGKIFEPFFTTKEKGKGTGLGLSTVYGIVQQCGGYVFAESELGRGSVLHVYLPIVDDPADSSEDEPPGRLPREREHRGTILLTEDETALRELAARVLEERGYEVLQAEDGDEAIALIGAHDGPVTLLLTDVVMPRMSGTELYRVLLQRNPDLAVVLMSGHTDSFVGRFSAQDLDRPFLRKPFTPESLLAKVEEAIRTSEGRSGRPRDS